MAEKFEREIEELLSRLGEWVPQDTPLQRSKRVLGRWLFRWQEGWRHTLANLRNWRAPLDQLMLAGIVLVVLSYFLRFAVPVVARYTGVLGVILFFTAFALYFSMGRQQRRDIRWRGRLVEPGPAAARWWSRLRRLLFG